MPLTEKAYHFSESTQLTEAEEMEAGDPQIFERMDIYWAKGAISGPSWPAQKLPSCPKVSKLPIFFFIFGQLNNFWATWQLLGMSKVSRNCLFCPNVLFLGSLVTLGQLDNFWACQEIASFSQKLSFRSQICEPPPCFLSLCYLCTFWRVVCLFCKWQCSWDVCLNSVTLVIPKFSDILRIHMHAKSHVVQIFFFFLTYTVHSKDNILFLTTLWWLAPFINWLIWFLLSCFHIIFSHIRIGGRLESK